MNYLIQAVFDRASELERAREELSQAEDCLVGIETKYEGHYAVIEQVDGNLGVALLYVEEEPGLDYTVSIELEDLDKFIS